MVGPLAHLLKNRFYIGEVVYRGETHNGEHAPILASIESYLKPSRQNLPNGPFRESSPDPGHCRSLRS
jgi:hypothetical protein